MTWSDYAVKTFCNTNKKQWKLQHCIALSVYQIFHKAVGGLQEGVVFQKCQFDITLNFFYLLSAARG